MLVAKESLAWMRLTPMTALLPTPSHASLPQPWLRTLHLSSVTEGPHRVRGLASPHLVVIIGSLALGPVHSGRALWRQYF